ncbi:mercury methylation ferredoxin HgcB [Geotalea sp. SG265]|uniref:mercury methylation ferredoxin HgcB n=1 Tax=Geotalea sp. SG265 TaxID=2922867 RepID=UPI001FAEC084|nr:mercury methylation ferredoxin HgcB [Geotalea sp. SG265]
MKNFAYLRKVTTLKLERELCSGCGRCVEVCPHQVFSLTDGISAVANLDACMECGACARNCPAGATEVDAGVGCASGLIHEWLRERNIRGWGGECCG